MKHYRALISIPIVANSDDDPLTLANEQAASVRHPDGAIAGHVELVGEARIHQMEIIRVVNADPWLLRQLPPDWKV